VSPELLATVLTAVLAEDVVFPQGSLLCQRIQSNLLTFYTSCKGIPYALPPTGNRRFRAPEPYPAWTQQRNATEHGAACLQPGYISGVSGDEDCLFLNVYSPNVNGNRAVMFWIHGGTFAQGSGGTTFYGPEPLINEDVVVVTVNYRLGILGFLSTGDDNAQGNYGLKDVVLALKWVQENIRYFGGDPSRVTIFGENSGSVMVNLLVLSPAGAGLFSRAISQSGVALSPWAFQNNPVPNAFEAGRRLGIEATSTADLVTQLRAVTDLEAIARATDVTGDLKVPRAQNPFPMAPVAEIGTAEPPFLTQTPLEIMKSGVWNSVPYIIGTNSEEALYGGREFLIDLLLFTKYNVNLTLLAPPTWGLDASRSQVVTEAILGEYFSQGRLTDTFEYIQYCTDTHFHYPIWKTVQLMSRQPSPLYYYVFGFVGDLNIPKRTLLLTSYPGAMHADEIPYLFRLAGFPAPILPGNPAYTARARMTQMWTNFAFVGNPTPSLTSTITAFWPRVQTNIDYFSITADLTPSQRPKNDRMTFWEELDKSFGPGY